MYSFCWLRILDSPTPASSLRSKISLMVQAEVRKMMALNKQQNKVH